MFPQSVCKVRRNRAPTKLDPVDQRQRLALLNLQSKCELKRRRTQGSENDHDEQQLKEIRIRRFADGWRHADHRWHRFSCHVSELSKASNAEDPYGELRPRSFQEIRTT